MKTNQTWGGRFEDTPDDIMTQINASIDIDKRLWREDISGSKAHCEMLVKQEIISEEDGAAILKGLDKVAAEIETGQFKFSAELEDIHMNIEHRLREIIGDTAGKLHTARSRNDQVAVDFKMWIRAAAEHNVKLINTLQVVISDLSEKHKDTIIPGFTHLQVAQPVTLSLHFDAYHQMLERDKSRFQDCAKRLNECPLGAAALSGTGFPIDRNMTANALGFDHPMSNSMDAVASRDFAIEFLYCAAQCGLHLSRLAEELIIWATPQFGFVTLSDAWSTGSSIMPQKKNPDAAELVRAKTGVLNGNLIQLMTVMKALPLTYNKDMQEDKASSFASYDALCLCLQSMTGMLETAEFHTDKMLQAANDGYSTATEIADWLVREVNMPFRDAHHITGKIVKLAIGKNCLLEDLPLKDMQDIESQITEDIYRVLDPKGAVKSRGL